MIGLLAIDHYFFQHSLLTAIMLCALQIGTPLFNVLRSGKIKQEEASLLHCLICDHQRVLILFF